MQFRKLTDKHDMANINAASDELNTMNIQFRLEQTYETKGLFMPSMMMFLKCNSTEDIYQNKSVHTIVNSTFKLMMHRQIAEVTTMMDTLELTDATCETNTINMCFPIN